MQKILINKTSTFEIEDGGSITNIEKVFNTLNDVTDFMESLMNSFSYCIEFTTESDSITATYENMVLTEPNFKITKENSQFKVSFGFRELTESEENFETVQIAISYLTDEQALTVKNLYADWDGNGIGYLVGDRVQYNGKLYKCLQAHTSQSDWSPEAAQSLWAEILAGQDGTEIGEWTQPESTNPYSKGDRVTHNGKTWESLTDGNVWEPGVQGTESLWKEVTE